MLANRLDSKVVRAALGVGAGLLAAAAFPPLDVLAGWIIVPAFALMLAVLRGLSPRVGALVGMAAGCSFFLVLLSWLRVLGVDVWLLLSLVCALFWAATGAVLPILLRRRRWVALVPLAWVVQEAVRVRVPWGGFPWGRLAFAQPDTWLVGWAALGGPALVSGVVALLGCLMLATIDACREHDLKSGLIWAFGFVVVAGAGRGWLAIDLGGPIQSAQPIAIVQGNVPRVGLDFDSQRRAVLDNHVRETLDLVDRSRSGKARVPVAVVWPENSSDLDPFANADAAAAISRAAKAAQVPVLVGAVVENPVDSNTILNVALIWDPESGPGDRYVKRHPVPFGEYLPMRKTLSRWISRFDRIPRDFSAGSVPGMLQLGPIPSGIVICFETAYDGLVRDAVRAGGQVLIVQTNNATYGLTGQPEQQLAISRVQSVASGRTTLVAATSGVSAVIEPSGALDWRTQQFVSDSTVAEVGLRTGLTPAMRWGALVEPLALLLLVLLMMLKSGRIER